MPMNRGDKSCSGPVHHHLTNRLETVAFVAQNNHDFEFVGCQGYSVV
jgi:hypothetical protein